MILLQAEQMPEIPNFCEDDGAGEYRFPPSISYGSSGGPQFKTVTFTASNGRESVMPAWEQVRATYTANIEDVGAEAVNAVTRFFYAMRGRAGAFRYRDWNDYTISNQPLFVGDGSTTEVQLFKRYSFGPSGYNRIIRKPCRGTMPILAVGDATLNLGTDYTVAWRSGLITFSSPPAAGEIVRVPFVEYDVPVRFDTDSLEVSCDDFDSYSMELSFIEIIPENTD